MNPIEPTCKLRPILLEGGLGSLVGQEFDFAHQQMILRLEGIPDSKLRTAAGDDAEHAVIQRVEVDDRAIRTDAEYVGLSGAFTDARIGTFANEDDTKAGFLAQTAADHCGVTRFEDAQRQPPATEQHGAQREQRNLFVDKGFGAHAQHDITHVECGHHPGRNRP